MKNLTFAFDIGYASIGWSAIEYEADNKTEPSVIGTGVVLFEADSCLASKRREYRRMRRTIRSRRKRIERIAQILVTHKVISQEEAAHPGHPAPFFLAARALQGKYTLSAVELWHVLRWYAHNRGYDGNSQWSNANDEGTERETMAKEAMVKHGTNSMAETITRILELDTNAESAQFSVTSPKYRKLNLAFPRSVVEREVEQIITSSTACSDIVKKLIFAPAKDFKEELFKCGVRFPKRYYGSILFGQLIPRFDNRIIARCPITWALTYQNAINTGKNDKAARKEADKFAKVPKADCPEFYEYRYARILANIRVNNSPLPAEIRQQLMEAGRKTGRFTKTSFTKLVQELTGNAPNNLRNYFHLTPDADKALIISPNEQQYKASGRAPYARPVLWQVVDEVLRGEDPSKPALSPAHPNGEQKASDGILYALHNPESDVYKLQQARSVEQQTNNHLVRHRMLIFERLLKDMLEHYANGNPEVVKQCCIEVNRELKEFSGLTAMEIKQQLKEKLKDFQSAVNHLKKHAPDIPMTAGLIRKCRIAMDLKWTCPYSGMTYGPYDLPHMDKDHIVPFASRNTNAMSALVLTYPEVNRMKGKRTAVEFIQACQGQSVEGKENIHIWTEKRFKAFVEKLDAKGAPDDRKRKAKRKKLLLVETTPAKGEKAELGFTEGQLTQSSHLVRIASQVAKNKLSKARIISIPGQVTAEVRKAWKLLGTIAPTVEDICYPAENKQDKTPARIKEKSLIREITHLHHAVDACTLGLIPILIPAGDNGTIWKLLTQRQLNEAEQQIFKSIGYNPVLSLTEKNRIYLHDISCKVKSSIASAIKEKRVVRHVPADMSGAKMNEQYCGVIDYNADDYKLKNYVSLRNRSSFYGIAIHEETTCIPRKEAQTFINETIGKSTPILRFGQVISISHLTGNDSKQNGNWQIVNITEEKKNAVVTLERIDPNGNSKTWSKAPIAELWNKGHITPGKILPVKTWVQKSKLMGLNSPKMKLRSAALIITDNYGVVISPITEILRHATVYKNINRLKTQYPGKSIQILRKNMVISLTSHKDPKKNGKWRIASVKEDRNQGLVLDLQYVDSAISKDTTAPQNWRGASLNTICNSGLIIHKKLYVE